MRPRHISKTSTAARRSRRIPPVEPRHAKPPTWPRWKAQHEGRPWYVRSLLAIEWGLEWFYCRLRGLALFDLLELAGRCTVLIIAIFWLMEADDRTKERHYRAWELINSARGSTGDGGRRDALQDLNRDGVSLAAAPLEKAYLPLTHLKNAKLMGADLRGAKLMGADLSGAKLMGADLKGANLREADLEGASLRNTDLSGADLTGANLKNTRIGYSSTGPEALGSPTYWGEENAADLSGAILWATDLKGVELAFMDLKGKNLIDADLSGADLGGADLSEAKLINAKLIGAKLMDAKLIGADLRRADLEGAMLWSEINGMIFDPASLEGADLRGAINLTQEQLKAVIGDDKTILPEGLTRPAHWRTTNKTREEKPDASSER